MHIGDTHNLPFHSFCLLQNSVKHLNEKSPCPTKPKMILTFSIETNENVL